MTNKFYNQFPTYKKINSNSFYQKNFSSSNSQSLCSGKKNDSNRFYQLYFYSLNIKLIKYNTHKINQIS